MRRTVLWMAAALCACLAAVLVLLVSIPTTSTVGGNLRNFFGFEESGDDAVTIQGADLSGSGPGSLVSAVSMPALKRSREGSRMQAARVVYRSVNGDTGQPTVVSGSVFTPLGSPPGGGWPVVSFGHGTTGIDEPCAPSLSDSLLGFLRTVSGLVDEGYAVAFADFQGLGSDGVHPYPDSRTAGLNMIDAVRALRSTFENVGTKWAAFGGSQGGGAAWAADEQADTYAPELDHVGSVAISPAADISGMVDKAEAGTLTSDQGPAFQIILESLSRLHPDLNRDDYRRGAASQYWDVLSSCSGPLVHDRPAAANALGAHDLSPSTPAAADRLRELLRRWALPQQRLSAPLSVVYGGQDTFIDAKWTTDAIAGECALGGTVVWQFQPEKGHGTVDIADQFSWIADRFEGKRVTNECP
jgi:hypothetical protein